jgi:ABC-type dipeptide/oligopeptide/nickel transport system permease subunit
MAGGGPATPSDASAMIGAAPAARGVYGGTAPRSSWALIWRAVVADRPALAGLLFIALVVLVSVTAPLFSPYDPTAPVDGSRLSPPLTPGHPLGIDGQQRDVLARLLWGGRISLLSGIVPTAAATAVSLALGATAAYVGGAVETAVMRSMDVLFAFPSALLAIAIAGALGPNERNQMLAIGIVLIPYITRVVHDSVRSVRVLPYIEASRSLGASTRRMLLRHVVPNAFPPVLAYGTSLVGMMMVLSSGLSFLGLGVQPPTADWGAMVRDAKDVLSVAPWLSAMPGVLILLTALAFNYLGDGLSDALEPRRRRLKAAGAAGPDRWASGGTFTREERR